MAKLVLGIGTGHTPLISEPPEFWRQHGESEIKNPRNIQQAYGGGDPDQLMKEREGRLASQVTDEEYKARYDKIQKALDGVRSVVYNQRPDVLIVVGDDQRDAFLFDYMPAMCIYRGETIVNKPVDTSHMPAFAASWLWGYRSETEESYPCDPDLANQLIQSLIKQQFDAAYLTEPAAGRQIGHAFTFINRRILTQDPIPQVPLMLNTYFPPNSPVAARCWALGQAVRKAVESWDSDKTVALVASGGLSHPIVDEELDRKVLDAIEKEDGDALCKMDEDIFRLGNSEIKNWITVAAAMAGTGKRQHVIDYIPAYRTTAGTGCGIAFTHWS